MEKIRVGFIVALAVTAILFTKALVHAERYWQSEHSWGQYIKPEHRVGCNSTNRFSVGFTNATSNIVQVKVNGKKMFLSGGETIHVPSKTTVIDDGRNPVHNSCRAEFGLSHLSTYYSIRNDDSVNTWFVIVGNQEHPEYVFGATILEAEKSDKRHVIELLEYSNRPYGAVFFHKKVPGAGELFHWFSSLKECINYLDVGYMELVRKRRPQFLYKNVKITKTSNVSREYSYSEYDNSTGELILRQTFNRNRTCLKRQNPFN